MNTLIDKTPKALKSLLPNSVKLSIKSYLAKNDLTKLAEIYGTDKWGLHRYAQHYQTHFLNKKQEALTLLEIGVGGHDDPLAGGNSLRMWKAYFPHAKIYAIDIYDKSPHEEQRIKIFRGSQSDPDFLLWVIKQIGNPDIIIDDGSHINEHVLVSLDTLYPFLKFGGIYAIEDLQTSYWPQFGGCESGLSEKTSIMRLKNMIDGLNWEEFINQRTEQPFDKTTNSLHFYHNLCFIYKNNNIEGTNKNAHQIIDK